MCGIIGIFNPASSADELATLGEAMTAMLAHRGPDDSNVWQCAGSGLVLGHRRLSIQDLSPLGSQPMRSHTGRYTLVFNGEIYNFKDIGRTLTLAGHEFKGHSDTEVLLTAIEAWGLEPALKRCIGMFALGLWDSQARELHLVRDRIGEKPLYYGRMERGFAFGSELKVFSPLPRWSQDLDMNALGSYLRFGYISAPHTIFTNVRKLQPGHILTIKLADSPLPDLMQLTAEQRPFWSVLDLHRKDPHPIDDRSAIARLERLLGDIVREHGVADVPLGSFLSGGIDSSLVAAIFQANSARPIQTFTIGFNDPAFNEAEQAKAIARHLGADHTELYVTPSDALNAIPAMADIYDEPFADSSQIPTYLVCKLARSQVTVCLAGDGGDELFGGYNRYQWTQRIYRHTRHLPRPIRALLAGMLGHIPPRNWDRLAEFLFMAQGRKGPSAVGLKAQKLTGLLVCENLQQAYTLLSSYWDDPAGVMLAPIEEPVFERPTISDRNFLRDAMFWDQQWYLPGDNLVKTDRASMAVSLEVRLPLLDQRLIEFSAELPDTMKIRNGQTKWLLRQLLYQHVPKELVERPKMGFSAPIARWLREELRDWAGDLLSEQHLRSQSLFEPGQVSRILDQHFSGSHDHSHKLWTLLMFQQWHANQRAGQQTPSACWSRSPWTH
jgi:asparagine synthase (glutamine-hydrolysing)